MPVAVVTPGRGSPCSRPPRAASGVVIGVGPQSLTCLVALWLGHGREVRAGDPDVLTLSPVWPLSTGAWDIDGLEPELAGGLRQRAVVARRPRHASSRDDPYSRGATMQLAPTAAMPAGAMLVYEPAELLARAA